MPITSVYRVQCDVCFAFLDDEYETRDAALDAREEAGWEDLHGGTVCPQHNPASSAV